MSKREYLLQKGRQIQQLNAEATQGVSTPVVSGKKAAEIARLRDLCPEGTDDHQISQILQQTRGDAKKIEASVSDLWEQYRGRGSNDWATVSKKGKKKSEPTPSRSSEHTQSTWGDDNQPGSSAERSGGRGRGASRGRGMSRGGRSGRGRGRGASGPGRGSRANGTHAGVEQKPESVSEAPTDKDENSQVSDEASTTEEKKRSAKKHVAPEAAMAPPVVTPVLTGAWKKKPNLGGIGEKAKPVSKPSQEQMKPTTEAPSPKKTVEVKSPEASPKPEKVPSAKKVASPKEDVNAESSSIASGWGSLDVSNASISDWAAKSETTQAAANSAWGRGSPMMTSVAKNESASSIPAVVPGSPKDIQMPHEDGRADESASSSPKQYLRMGKWETVATTNLSLQFGSFSLSNVDHVESTSPRGWGSATVPSTQTTATATEANNAWGTQPSPKKKVPLSPSRPLSESDQTSVQSQIGSQIGSDTSRKNASATSSAPPGLSVEAGGVSPKASQSPRTFAPSAPSPASLPKPDEVKRATPTRGQSHFQNQNAGQTQPQSKLNIGSTSSYGAEFSKSSGLYQSGYGQYPMDLVNRNASGSSGGTPKGSTSRGVSSIAGGTAQSPTHSAQQGQAAQLQQLQMQIQQPQQQAPQQSQTTQASKQQAPAQAQPAQQSQSQQPTAQTPNSQQPHPTHPQFHQSGPQGFHPHYAPPPPPGMALPYNPYNYGGYYQGYGYYQNPQYPQYSPRTQYPPRGSIPYGMEGPMPGFSNPPNMPVGYQDQHMLAHQHEFPGGVPQGFGDISGAYLQQPPHQQHQNASHHGHQQSGPPSHGKGSAPMGTTQQSHSGRGNSSAQSYPNSGGAGNRDSATPPVPNASAGGAGGSYGGQHYGWASYGGQPVGSWGHMVPQNYQQNPSQQQQQQQQQQQHPGTHQASYRSYGNNSGGATANTTESGSSSGSHGHGHNSWNA